MYVYIKSRYISVSSYLLYLLSNDDWVCFSYLILAQLFVVKFTVVFVRISVFPAEQAAASTIKTLVKKEKKY